VAGPQTHLILDRLTVSPLDLRLGTAIVEMVRKLP